MPHDPQVLFSELWETLSRRVAAGKSTRDEIRFFLTDGRVRRLEIPQMNELTQQQFLALTFDAINNHPVEAILIHHEIWFVDTDVSKEKLKEFIDKNPRPRDHPKKKEGISFYYETADGTITCGTAEITTGKKNKRNLGPIEFSRDTSMETRLSHLFKKARQHASRSDSYIDGILRRN
jgi:hypothetical protein